MSILGKRRNASENDYLQAAEFLLKQGADINQRFRMDVTPLMQAAFLKQLPLVELFCKYLRINNNPDYQWAAVIEGIKGGSLEVVQTLLDHNNFNVNHIPKQVVYLEPPLPAICYAVQHAGNEELSDAWQILQEFILRNADINLRDSYGMSSLFYVANKSDIKLFKQLLSSGAIVDYRNNHDKNIVDLVSEEERENRELVTTLGAPFTLFAWIRTGTLRYSSCLYLLKWGAHLNQRTQSGQTPLHLACVYAQSEPLRALLASIKLLEPEAELACLTARNNRGHTPLDILATRTSFNDKAAKESNDDYIKIPAQQNNACVTILLNSIQPFFDLKIFKIKKIIKTKVLPLDAATEIIECDMPRFSFTADAESLRSKSLLRAMNSKVIDELAKTYRDQAETHQAQAKEAKSKQNIYVNSTLDSKFEFNMKSTAATFTTSSFSSSSSSSILTQVVKWCLISTGDKLL